MQRWFFLEKSKTKPKVLREIKKTTAKTPSNYTKKMDHKKIIEKGISTRQWKLSVSAPDVRPREKVCLTGNIPELGEWDYNRVVSMDHEQGTNIWTTTLTVPNNVEIQYRYVICLLDNDSDSTIVLRWETSIHPRTIKLSDSPPVVDIFGTYGDQTKITRGWLTKQTLIQFKFLNNPLKLKSRLSGRALNIKITPVKLTFNNQNEAHHEDSSLSVDVVDTEVTGGVSVEVSTCNDDAAMCVLQPQGQFGREYKPNDVLLINVSALDINALAYLVDFYSFSTRASLDDPPCHVGYTYVLPNMFKPSEGILELPVTCNIKHRPLGTVNIQYLIVRPMEEKLCDLKVSYLKHWDPSWTGLEVGHRGLGASFKTKEGSAIRENTVASLKKAASSGADLLEFDVQLSKDMIPVIYHDFHVCISMKRKKELDYAEMLELPVKDLTLEHLQKLKVYHLVEGRSHEVLFDDEDLEEHQPFPTLQHVLHCIDPHVGFNVELKWTMELQDGTFELNNPFDMNTYVDKVLEVVLKYADERRIVFSCFNPDIVTMVRLKQNKYPVMFLTVGTTIKWKPYRDPRCVSIPSAVQHAISADILGIVVHTEDLLRDPTQVKLATNAGLVIFCWGDDNNDKDTIRRLKGMGLHAVIYDKLDQYITKEVKESIFLMEARESQRDIMRLAALEEAGGAGGGGGSEATSSAPPRAFLDLARLRGDLSTATSLESLASSIDFRDDTESEKCLKRSLDSVVLVDKDAQLKQQPRSFKDLFPAGDSAKGARPKIPRSNK
ncbi:hypothetical protein JYU34_002669 [Plutella xylostella]|uniref:Glycerophosphocholine phosphodiesterase GPCPD1 n=1 Tax=Plutella xylostella TaxID=51655 RepID=A0ABQ7R2U7_PLUXY|nr:hypothetical protein JYU34_002669 [Plutella xylostella]